MGVLVDLAMKVIEQQRKATIEEARDKYMNACKQATKDIHKEIVEQWFGEYNGQSVVDATCFHSKVSTRGDKMSIKTHFYTDVGAYKEKPKAERWRAKNGGALPGKVWVLVKLQMYTGIIGLPGYINSDGEAVEPTCQRNTTLLHEIVSSSNWGSLVSRVKSMAK